MKKKILSLALALVLIFALTACGGAEEAARPSNKTAEATAPESSAPQMMDMAMPEAEFEYSSDSGVSSTTGGSTGRAEAISAEKIIYSADAGIETKEYDKTIEAIYAMVDEYGGFLESSSISGTTRSSSRGRNADFVMRIPSERFNELTGRLSDLGNVSYCRTYSENVTTEYIDVESRLESYRIQEQRLLAMLEKATELEDMLTIEEHLADVRYHIESYTTQLNYLDSMVSYSTVTLSVEEVVDYTPDQSVTRTFGDKMGSAFSDSLDNIVDLFQGLILMLLRSWYLILAFAVVIVIVIRKVKKDLKKRNEKDSSEK